MTVEGFAKGGSLTVITPMEGGDVQCSVTVDGAAPQTARASGKSAAASCTGF
ncbi:hypothetical protein GCM10010171_18080 [Actinokineospora fastidiosa]|uniref:Uncharacterized protein n=1 Tax=Actinokineospora fastidiosa TaxID=1816 RepID=A0A918GA79_9PSEU|nr:hypothetical protein [Actinokineospora sp. UTMC 2448]UVS81867.1 hypothetical protein Actkin_05631 [Actinokineospora sp. UTMC 2448]GGS25170.1 hypothetical protein GCM10010171_18080 [Actinokineospora fastidiosa]